MKSVLLLFLYLCCFYLPGKAQGKKIDSLYQRLSVITGVREKINTGNQIASELRSNNADSAIVSTHNVQVEAY